MRLLRRSNATGAIRLLTVDGSGRDRRLPSWAAHVMGRFASSGRES